jgi:pyruvate/2-oxoglutarate dehydrogenase complex dihydrolipoamide dehydrogenase (E3) component
MTTSCDAIVIGSGQAGPSLAVRLAQAGMKVVLVEREHLGGTCVNDGCIPTKAMVASARAAHVARTCAEHGVHVGGDVRVDLHAVQARKNRVVAESVEGLTSWLHGTPGLDVILGHARFTGPHEIDVGGRRFTAPKVFVNVGGRAVLPAWPGIADVPVLTNTSMMHLDVLPEHLLVAGGSYIGLEFAQMFRRFGSRVTVLEVADRLIAREDPEVSAEVRAILEREGIECLVGVKDVHVEALEHDDRRDRPAAVHVLCTAGGRMHELRGTHLLAAVGRRPNTDDLGLAAAGIATDARGYIVVDDQLRTNVEGVYALGDCNGRGAFTHTAYNDFEIVAANLLDGTSRRVSDRIPAYALFTDPPLGRVGMTEAEVRASGRPALVGVMQMARVGRARERGETQGFMKVLVDAQTEHVLGASLLGIEADEVVHLLLDAMAAGVSYRALQRTMHIHPTVSELIPTLLGTLAPLAATPAA